MVDIVNKIDFPTSSVSSVSMLCRHVVHDIVDIDIIIDPAFSKIDIVICCRYRRNQQQSWCWTCMREINCIVLSDLIGSY